jgi:hypothetical protein
MSGVVAELPDAINLTDYNNRLNQLMADLKTLPCGDAHADRFEEIVGDVIRFCFFRALSNVQPQSRGDGGRVIRDWIAANTAVIGFWEMLRHRYNATQVIWECKNYRDLSSSDFHQFAYYMTREVGRLVVVSFRGDIKNTYYHHIRRISNDKNGAMVLLLTDADMLVFMRQAVSGKSKEDHIQTIYDRTTREIS